MGAGWLETDFVCDRKGRRFIPHWHQRRRVRIHPRQLDAWYRTLDQLVAEFTGVFTNADGNLFAETYNQLNAYFATVPGNYALNLRKLYLLNTNYADLSFLFTILPGEKTNAYLGTEYLAVLETDSSDRIVQNLSAGPLEDLLATRRVLEPLLERLGQIPLGGTAVRTVARSFSQSMPPSSCAAFSRSLSCCILSISAPGSCARRAPTRPSSCSGTSTTAVQRHCSRPPPLSSRRRRPPRRPPRPRPQRRTPPRPWERRLPEPAGPGIPCR